MARPATKTDDERMLPCAVSLDRARREKFKALGGSAWLRVVIDSATVAEPVISRDGTLRWKQPKTRRT